MIRLDIPGWRTLELEQLLLDLNGTIALDGEILPGVAERLDALSACLSVYLVTADTQGRATETGEQLGIRLLRIGAGDEAGQKRALVQHLDAQRVVAIGNGANDVQLLSLAAVGIAVLGPEGLAVGTMQAADVVVSRIEDALDLLLYPGRLIATLRR